MQQDVKKIVCSYVCQVAEKSQTDMKVVPWHPIPIVKEPFSPVLVEIIVPFAQTKKGFAD